MIQYEVETNICNLVKRVICESNGVNVDIRLHDRLLEDGFLDSLSMVGLITALHAEYGVEVQGPQINDQNFGSVADIAQLILASRT